jgi:hypothetical protein
MTGETIVDNTGTYTDLFQRKTIIYNRAHMIKVEEHLLKILKDRRLTGIHVEKDVIRIDFDGKVKFFTSRYNYTSEDWEDMQRSILLHAEADPAIRGKIK